MKKTGQIKQEKITVKKSVGRLFDELKTEIGISSLSKKLGVSKSSIHAYTNFLRYGQKQKKSDRTPTKETIKKIESLARKTKVKVYKIVTEKKFYGKMKKPKLRSKKVFTGKYKRLKLTEKVHKTMISGTGQKVIQSNIETKIKRAMKRKNFAYFFVRVHIEYYVKNLGLISQWYSFVVKQKTFAEVEKQVSAFLGMKKKQASVMYFKILELNFDIIEKTK